MGGLPSDDYASNYYIANSPGLTGGPVIDFQVQLEHQTSQQNRKTRKSKEKRTALINNGKNSISGVG